MYVKKNPNLNVNYATVGFKASNNGNILSYTHTHTTYLAKLSMEKIQVHLIGYGFKASLTIMCD